MHLSGCGGAVTLAVLGLLSGLLRKPPLTALSPSPQAGGLLAAAALIGHAVQDVLVLRAKQVVTRSMAEFCLALDFALGIVVLVAAT